MGMKTNCTDINRNEIKALYAATEYAESLMFQSVGYYNQAIDYQKQSIAAQQKAIDLCKEATNLRGQSYAWLQNNLTGYCYTYESADCTVKIMNYVAALDLLVAKQQQGLIDSNELLVLLNEIKVLYAGVESLYQKYIDCINITNCNNSNKCNI